MIKMINYLTELFFPREINNPTDPIVLTQEQIDRYDKELKDDKWEKHYKDYINGRRYHQHIHD
jgi:hypothetical protein